jgi:phospholipid/cholesterol/gamma-HCH transport system permease protein
LLSSLKKSLRDFFLFISFVIEVIVESISIWKNRKTNLVVLTRQILFTGVEALPIISFVALGIGGLIILQGYNILSSFGQGNWIHLILVSVVIRELSGIFTALIVIARSGTAISTELGNMVVNHEIDLLKSFNISPISYLVTSRVLGVIIAMFILTIYFNIIAVLGGWFFSSMFSTIDFMSFMSEFANTVKISDITISILKSVVFGFVIAMMSCYQGLQVSFALTEVPQRTIKAVVQAMVLVIFFDVLLTVVFYYVT